MSIIDDEGSNSSDNEHFQDIVNACLSRRDFLTGGIAAAAAASLGGLEALLKAVPVSAQETGEDTDDEEKAEQGGRRKQVLGFESVPVSSVDEVVVPKGYTAEVLIAWGDPVSNGPAFKQDASNTAEDQARQWGMHNDGIVYFPILRSQRGLIVQNNEYTDDGLLFPDGVNNWTAEKTKKSLNAHGVSIIEVAKRSGFRFDVRSRRGKWDVVRPSRFARRITGMTPIDIGGPAAGDPRLVTSDDPTGTRVLGTLNNCAMGHTPWGTYLACEENFNGYFRKNGPQTELEKRYGITATGSGYSWHTTDKRFQVDEEPNEPNRFGWVVEIDPFKPHSTPVKRTALGRLKHEGAWVQEARNGKVVVSMGDDERNEYIYRYVSNLPWRQAHRQDINPLDDGILYVAKFHTDGTGEWLPLTTDNPRLAGWSLNDILVNTRGAADAAGATMMDRPEWIDTFPRQLTAIATLTNNNRRGTTPPSVNNPDGSSAAGSARPQTDAVNPRPVNNYGHIIRWYYRQDWTEPTFGWDIFALCGDPANPAHGATIFGDPYGSPDGIYVDPGGLLWIQTDVSTSTINAGAYAGFGNNMMLAADPETRETRRFLVGPNQCEITGICMTPDRRTMFVGIQHPGERPDDQPGDPSNPKQFSSWPDGPSGGRPRSALIAVTKDDGGEIGS
ncbi:PhoX family protein [Nitrospira sp. BLG_2]|uniref:PhoX family protein n=1 Tax=Nitrospira sp. BLG_2 TaxID=3397507 RepID=UPI003B9B08D6